MRIIFFLLLILTDSINLRRITIIRATSIKRVSNHRNGEFMFVPTQTKSRQQQQQQQQQQPKFQHVNAHHLKNGRKPPPLSNESTSIDVQNLISDLESDPINGILKKNLTTSNNFIVNGIDEKNKHLFGNSSSKLDKKSNLSRLPPNKSIDLIDENTVAIPILNDTEMTIYHNEQLEQLKRQQTQKQLKQNEKQKQQQQQQQQQQIHDFNILLASQFARNELAKHIINEFVIKNLTGSLDTSPIRFNESIKEALSTVVTEQNIFMGNPLNISNGFLDQGQVSLDGSLMGVTAATKTGAAPMVGANHLGGHISGNTGNGSSRPFFGEVFHDFQSIYWPIHCVLCLIICTLGIFANVINIIVLTRPNMVTPVNYILTAMAASDLIVNISNIPYLWHELSDSSNEAHFYSYLWALYILFHAHITVTAHTVSIWLTCALATWRYFVVCRSQSTNQRNWSVGLAKWTIISVIVGVVVFCIPNYLSFATSEDVTESNVHIFKVGFSKLANESHIIKTFHFWIFSCLTKLLPCILLIFFTIALIRKLLSARDRKVRLATYGTGAIHEMTDCNKKFSITSGQDQVDAKSGLSNQNYAGNGGDNKDTNSTNQLGVIINSSDEQVGRNLSETRFISETVIANSICPGSSSSGIHGLDNKNEVLQHLNSIQQHSLTGTPRNESNSTIENELIKASCDSSTSGYANGNNDRVHVDVGGDVYDSINSQQPRPIPMSQLFVESTDKTTISTTTVPPNIIASCDIDQQQNNNTNNINLTVRNKLLPQHRSEQRSASTCGNLESYSSNGNSNNMDNLKLKSNHSNSSTISSQKHAFRSGSHNTNYYQQNFSEQNQTTNNDLTKHGSLKLHKNGDKSGDKPSNKSLQVGRSVGSITISPVPMVRIQAAQRQISHNETTTRLLIAVMIVFLICELPSGILAALCAVLGQEFFENVYQPTGILMDLLALINSSVNFILYCFMSTQFRVTFYQVILRCPAPIAAQQGQTILMKAKDQNHDRKTPSSNSIGPERTKNRSRNDY